MTAHLAIRRWSVNKLIEELWEKYSDDYDIRKTEFKQAIQTACQAQRNACLRESDKFKTSLDIKIRDSERESIKNAEITKED